MDCERKASATAMSLVAKYPNRVEIIPELIDIGVEELEHFQQVYKVMQSRGIQLSHTIHEDLYIKGLMKSQHEDAELARFYKMLWTSEAKHGHVYVKMALLYFPEDKVYKRLAWWIDKEAEIVRELPLRAALH